MYTMIPNNNKTKKAFAHMSEAVSCWETESHVTMVSFGALTHNC